MSYVGGTWWELKLADGWQAQGDVECLTLSRSKDGAFQLSAAVKNVGAVLPEEIEEQSRQSAPNGTVVCSYSVGKFSGLCVSYRELGAHWQRFWLAHGNLLVFATYNGSPDAWCDEQQDVHAMLATLRPRDAENVLPA